MCSYTWIVNQKCGLYVLIKLLGTLNIKQPEQNLNFSTMFMKHTISKEEKKIKL
jgi:hypothetical protein